jgi:acetyl esterase/lipase
MKNLIYLLLILQFQSLGQNHRYTNTFFSSNIATNNVVYGSAPFINGPLYTVESSTTIQNLLLDIYRPTGDVFMLRPAIIFAHAGAFETGSKTVDDMKAFCDTFAKKGYVAVSMDYRQGFNLVGNTDMHATRAVYRGLQDGRAAIRFLRANASVYGIDPNKIYFVGSSAGSFIGLHSIYLDQVSEIPPQTGVVNYSNATPPFSHTAPSLGGLDIGLNLSYNGMPDAVVSMWGAVKSTSLITSSNATPVFLIHGEADNFVSYNTASPFGYTSFPPTDGSNPINTKLNQLGIPAKETYFVPGQAHEFYGTTNGTWNGSGGNAYWPIIIDKITQFLWKRHKPTANFTTTTNTLTATFTSSSTGDLALWWDFGDGTTSNAQHPIHTYTTPGAYQVKLYIENDIKSWDEITKTVTVAAPLPLELVNFKGILEKHKIVLSWSAENEINISNFEIQKSKDGIRFQTIAIVDSKGTANGTYTYEDANDLNTINYYKLRINDKDSQFKYSPIISINNPENVNFDIQISPNPIQDYLNIHVINANSLDYTIVNALGNIILKSKENVVNNGVKIDFSAYPAGSYFIYATGDSGDFVVGRFVK